MGFTVKITGFSKEDGEKLVEISPQGWDAEELIQDKRFTGSRTRGYYYNYKAELSPDETVTLYNRYRGNTTLFNRLRCFKFRRATRPCQKLHDALVNQRQHFSHFKINIIEWESGL